MDIGANKGVAGASAGYSNDWWQRAILDSADLTVVSTDTTGLILTCNAGVLRKLGYSAEEVIGKATPLLFHDQAEIEARARELSRELGRTIPAGLEVFTARAAAGLPDEHVWTCTHKDGTRFSTQISITAVRDAADVIIGYVGVGKDLTAQVRAQQALAATEERFHAFMDNSPALAFIKDSDGRYLYLNRPYERYLGISSEYCVGRTDSDLWPPEVAAEIVAHDREVLRVNRLVTLLEKAPARDGHITHWLAYKFPMAGPDGSRLLAGMSVDVTEQKGIEEALRLSEERYIEEHKMLAEANAQLKVFALTDGLTGLGNRSAFDDYCNREFARYERDNSPLSMVMLDLDNFKMYNDSFGHPEGDKLLKRIALILQHNARGADLAARYGGEEFALLLPATSAEVALSVAERLRQAIEKAPWTGRLVTASFGVATLDAANGGTIDQLIERADSALYQSKRAGRNKVTAAAPTEASAAAAAQPDTAAMPHGSDATPDAI